MNPAATRQGVLLGLGVAVALVIAALNIYLWIAKRGTK